MKTTEVFFPMQPEMHGALPIFLFQPQLTYFELTSKALERFESRVGKQFVHSEVAPECIPPKEKGR